ncbi:MAG: VOC family protein [Candidatus Competibacteraceae bacterium]|nr:VOC family protein [Candidatus Competibacteraceae bacterium]MBK8753953.1 VOC family protein [Candidatus Competibacteraceae bacterium]
MNTLGFQRLKVIALAVEDLARAERFYRDTLDLAPAFEGERQVGYTLGNVIVMLKPVADGWYARPSAQLNPRMTLATEHAPQTERELAARGVTISDPVQAYPQEGFYVGGFLDSEGNKIWFCSPIETAGG